MRSDNQRRLSTDSSRPPESSGRNLFVKSQTPAANTQAEMIGSALSHRQRNSYPQTEGPQMKISGERFAGRTKSKISAEKESVAVHPIDSEPAARARAVQPSGDSLSKDQVYFANTSP